MATDTVRDALNRLRGWGDTIRHYNTRTVVSGGGDTPDEWVGHEEFFADLALLTQRLAEVETMLRLEHENTLFLSASAHRALFDSPGCEVCALAQTAPERDGEETT